MDNVKNAINEGQNAVNSFDPTQLANDQTAKLNDFSQGQLNQGQSYMNDYTKAIASNPTVSQLYNDANTQFGVQPLKQQATYLTNQVNQAIPNAYKTMRGFNANDTQVQNAANVNLRFLQPAANAATANANNASELAQGAVNAGIQQNAQNLLPVQAYGQTLNQVLAGQMTGFNQNAQNRYQGLVAKMQSGVALSQTEAQELAQLEQAKTQYDATIAAANIGLQNTQLQNKYQTLGAGDTLVNTLNGQYQKAY